MCGALNGLGGVDDGTGAGEGRGLEDDRRVQLLPAVLVASVDDGQPEGGRLAVADPRREIVDLTNCQIQRITVRPETVNVTQGTDLTLPCKVENRAGRVQWVKSGVTLGYDREVAGYSRYSVIGAEGEGEFNFHIANVR